jgi:hypothetical protein
MTQPQQNNRIKSFFEDKFFKIRYIFSITADNTEMVNTGCDLPSVSFERIGNDNFSELKTMYQNEYYPGFFKKLEKRLDNPEIWQGYLVRADGKPAGTFWWLIPDYTKLLFDSFWVDTTSILFCGGYVHPSYRGKHLFSTMHFFSFDLLKKNFSDRTLLLIVEKRNTSSMNSMKRSKLKLLGSNYLVKILGKNVISLFKPNHGSASIWFLTGSQPLQ